MENKEMLNQLRNINLDQDELPEELKLNESGRYATYYAPFEYLNKDARIVICGITPGIQQAMIALRTAQAVLKQGLSEEEALYQAKHAASFAGPMRRNLAAMMDHIDLHTWLELDSCANLFEERRDLIHYTSALSNPVLDNGKNYSGGSSMIANPYLWDQIERGLGAEIRALPDALFIPLGKVDAVFERLIGEKVLAEDRVLFGLPHASGANAERIAYFCGRKAREALSIKTNPGSIDLKRHHLKEKVAALLLHNLAGHGNLQHE